MSELTQKFNPDEPYGEVHGKPGIRFMQDGVYFDAQENPVMADPQISVPLKKLVKRGRPTKVEAAQVKNGISIPDIHVKAQKENLAAASAERWVD